MNISKAIYTVEAHTAGEPLRLVTGGFPKLPGKTMAEKRDYFIEHYDHYRLALMREPRGHRDMFGAVMTPPCSPEADYGVFFMHGDGFHNMCGHGTIAVATIAVETGIVPVKEPETVIVQDSPAGQIRIRVRVENGKAKSVSFRNAPCFLFEKDVEVEAEDVGKVRVDLSFGGSFFALVSADQLGMTISPENAGALREKGMRILEALNSQIEIVHPEMDYIRGAQEIVIMDPSGSDGADLKNITVFDGQIDRSPCGTGTSAVLAAMYARGKIGIGEALVNESIIGTRFTGRIVDTVKVDRREAVIPEITGSASITGFSQFLIDEDDPVRYGFVLG